VELFSSSEEHGGINPRELERLGIPAAGLLDFSVNSNPFGPSPRVLEALRAVDVSAYPDRYCSVLTEMLAAANRVTHAQVLLGNGSSELIWLTARAFLSPGDEVVVIGPAFGEYRRACESQGAKVVELRAPEPCFQPPLEAAAGFIEQHRPRLVFLCNPNNPTGAFLRQADVSRVAIACGPDTILVLDEAYRAFADGEFFAGLPGGDCLVLRSMTKDFALAGLRLGYALGDPRRIDRLRALQPAWSVNAMALAAGAAAVWDIDYYRGTLVELRGLRTAFFAGIREAGFDALPSAVHYGLVQAGMPARELRLKLLAKQAIQVRDCASFGLPAYIRVSTRRPEDNLKLIRALTGLARNE
jgi:histidinol-phosphate aminotransferase